MIQSSSAKKIVWCALGALSLSTGAGPGCSSTKPTELVPGVVTQMVVPRDLKAVRISVTVNGATKFDNGYDVGPNGQVNLPTTLGVVSAESPNTPVVITIRGYQQPCDQQNDCHAGDISGNPSVNAAGGPIILRRSVQTFVDQHTLFLPMPLSYSCFEQDCDAEGKAAGKDMTCKGGQCVDSATDSTKLADFDPTLLDGTGLCFSPKACFPAGGPNTAPLVLEGQLVDADNCIYSVPATVQGSPGLNVRVFYQNTTWSLAATKDRMDLFSIDNAGEQEILDSEPATALVEGYAVLPNEQIQLAPGLCKLVKATAPPDVSAADPANGGTGTRSKSIRSITDVQISVACSPKVQLLPICADEVNPPATLPDGGSTAGTCSGSDAGADGGAACNLCNVALPLVPTTSAIYLAMDDSEAMYGAYGPKGYVAAMGLSLNDPVFKRTYAALDFFKRPLQPLTDPECDSTTTTGSFQPPDVPFVLANLAQAQIAQKIGAWAAPETPGVTCGTSADCAATPATPNCLGNYPGQNGNCYLPAPLNLQAAMRLDTGVYGQVLKFVGGLGETPNIAGAMFFVNRTPDSTGTGAYPSAPDCNPPLQGATSALDAATAQAELAFENLQQPIKTYFVVLDNNVHQPPLSFFQQVGQTVNAKDPGAVTVLDASSTNSKSVLANFAKTFTQLGTCLYTKPATVTGTVGTTISYGLPGAIPGSPQTVVPVDSTCQPETKDTANGWNLDHTGHVRLCGGACTSFQNFVLAVSAQAQQNGQTAPDVPLAITTLCPGTTPPPPSDGGAASVPEGGSSSTGDSGTSSDAASSTDATIGDAAVSDAAGE
jgi:hypothetical protein